MKKVAIKIRIVHDEFNIRKWKIQLAKYQYLHELFYGFIIYMGFTLIMGSV